MALALALAVTKKNSSRKKNRTGKQSVRIGTKCWSMMLDPDAWCNISDHHYSRIIGFTKKRRKKAGNLDGGLPKCSAPGSQLFSKRKSSGWQMDSSAVVH